MGGTRCSFQFCPNTSASKPGIHFFHFPVKYKERCELWIKNSGKETEFLEMPLGKLRNRAVCQEHFTKDSFMNSKQTSLTKLAVPTVWKSAARNIYFDQDAFSSTSEYLLGKEPIKTEKPKIINGSLAIPGGSRSKVDEIITDFELEEEDGKMDQDPQDEPVQMATNEKALQNCLTLTMQLNEKLTDLDKKMDERIKDCPVKSTSTIPNQSKQQLFESLKRHINPTMATLLGMELFASADYDWQPEEKDLAIELYSLGVPVYEYFRDQFRVRLPAIVDVQKWKEERDNP